ncbi:MAG: polysaccharide deacetylase family protein [Bacteroidetes bacterium]|nr:polysaccharide deacetylase family protein [Bacteroidota bacterium]
MSEGIEQIKKGKLKGTQVSISFDDGDISIEDFLVPLLKKHKIPATFFINTAYLNGDLRGYWYNIYNYLLHGNEKQQQVVQSMTPFYDVLRNTSNMEQYNEYRLKVEQCGEWIEKNVRFYVDFSFLKKLDPNLFEIGLHGHEHQRFSMMSGEWQKNNLLQNINHLKQFEQFRPIFAIPFGKPMDWNEETIKIARKLKLDIVLSNGGINRNFDQVIKRIPADGIEVPRIFDNLYYYAK